MLERCRYSGPSNLTWDPSREQSARHLRRRAAAQVSADTRRQLASRRGAPPRLGSKKARYSPRLASGQSRRIFSSTPLPAWRGVMNKGQAPLCLTRIDNGKTRAAVFALIASWLFFLDWHSRNAPVWFIPDKSRYRRSRSASRSSFSMPSMLLARHCCCGVRGRRRPLILQRLRIEVVLDTTSTAARDRRDLLGSLAPAAPRAAPGYGHGDNPLNLSPQRSGRAGGRLHGPLPSRPGVLTRKTDRDGRT